jgi:hypothetical protein
MTVFVCRSIRNNDNLVGEIPTQMGRLSKLSILYAFTAACCAFPHPFQSRRLSGNSLSGTIPSSLSSLTGLKQLYARLATANVDVLLRTGFSFLEGNMLVGTIPPLSSQLTTTQSQWFVCLHALVASSSLTRVCVQSPSDLDAANGG